MTISQRSLALAPVLPHPPLQRLGRRVRDLSALLDPNDDAGAYGRAHSFGFHRLLDRLHALPAALRADLLLFEEIDLRTAGQEHLVEPVPPDTATRLDAWLERPRAQDDPRIVVEWALQLLHILTQLQLHGIPSHLLLRPECVYVTGGGGILVGDLGLSLLILDPLRAARGASLPVFAAPEYLGRHAYARGDLADVHSVGCLVSRMLLPAAEFTFLGVEDARDKYVLPSPDLATPETVARLISTMTEVDPRRRPPLALAFAELGAAWRPRPPSLRSRVSTTARAVERFVDALLTAAPERIRTTLDALTAVAPEPLQRSLSQFTADARPLAPAELAAIVATLCDLIGRPGVDRSIERLALLGLALHHLGNLAPLDAAAICHQVRAIEPGQPFGEATLDLVAAVVEVEAALAAGRARELVMTRELLARPPSAPPARALFTALRGLVATALGDVTAASAALQDAEQGCEPASECGLLRHALARLRLHVALARLPTGFSLSDLQRLPAGEVHALAELAERELSLQVLPQFDTPLAVLFQSHRRGRAGAPPARSTRPLAVWRRRLVKGIRWEMHRIPGLAVQHYQRALALLPVDAAVPHHVEARAWLASAHQGAAREFVAREYLAPALAWLARLPFVPPRLAPALASARQFTAAPQPTRRHEPTPKSLLEALDAEAASTPRRTAHWILLQLLSEFGAVAATLTLLNQGSKPLHGATPQRATFLEALASCGWFEEMHADELSRLDQRLQELQTSDPLRVPLALAALTLPATTLTRQPALAAAREALQRLTGVELAAERATLDALIAEVNQRVTGTRRRLHRIFAPIDADIVHLAFVTPAAFAAALEAGLLYFHFTVDYAAVSSTGSPYDLLPGRDAAMTGAMQTLRAAQYTGNVLAHSADTLTCRAQISRGMLAELRLTGHLYRTYDEHERRALESRLAELVPAFMLVHDWTDRAPPVPTQLRVLHLMAHEAKRPLLWLQKAMTRQRRNGALTSEQYRELEGLLDLCVARLALFCGTKMWDRERFDLAERLVPLLDDWRRALRVSGEELELSDPFADRPLLRRLPPLELRGQAVELIVSELLENARKHSRPQQTIEIALEATARGTECSVELTIRNRVKSGASAAEATEPQTFVDRFNSTGLGMQLLGDLVRQLDDGRITGVRLPTDPPEHITRLTFKAPFVDTSPQP